MIVCTIGGKEVFPLTSGKIKITAENPFIKDSGEYSYEISFPMNVLENRRMFGNANRLDVSKRLPVYENCKLTVDGMTVMLGTGTVTSITAKEVKLQIVGGKSTLKYSEKLKERYIDEMEYPAVTVRDGVLETEHLDGNETWIEIQYPTPAFIGTEGEMVFKHAYDEYSDVQVNISHRDADRDFYLEKLAVQPNFMYVLRLMFENLGYRLLRNDLDAEPWNKLYINNVYQTARIKDALPHWTAYHFIEEMTKLFGCSVELDDDSRSVKILAVNEMKSGRTVEYECLDEFQCDYDEEGLGSNETSNLSYKLDDCEERNWRHALDMSLLKKFKVEELGNADRIEMLTSVWSPRRKRTTIFKDGDKYYAYIRPEGQSEAATKYNSVLTRIGKFSALIKNAESEDTVEISIVPAAFTSLDSGRDSDYYKSRILSNTNPRRETEDEMEGEGEDDYITVRDAIEGEEVITPQEPDGGTVQLFFCYKDNTEWNTDGRGNCFSYFETEPVLDWTPKTGGGLGYTEIETPPQGYKGTKTIPSLELWNVNKRAGGEIDAKNVVQIKFISDEMPSARDIFVFRGKRFIASKIEAEIADGHLSKIKTGYFYRLD